MTAVGPHPRAISPLRFNEVVGAALGDSQPWAPLVSAHLRLRCPHPRHLPSTRPPKARPSPHTRCSHTPHLHLY